MDFHVEMKFWPRDEMLVGYYLHGRKEGLPSLEIIPGTIYELDVYATEPWNLPSEYFTHGKDGNQGFFFTQRQPKAAARGGGSGVRVKRTAGSGTWHGQGHLTSIDSIPAGLKTTLTFKRSDGTMTDWLMQEYVLNAPGFQTLALCRIYRKHQAVASRGRKRPCNQQQQQQQQPLAQQNDRHLLDRPDPCPKRSRLGKIPIPGRSPPAAVDPNIWEEPSSLPKFHEHHILSSTGGTTASASSSEHPLPPDNSPIPVPEHSALDHEYDQPAQDHSSTINNLAPAEIRSDHNKIIYNLDDGGEIDQDDFFNSLPVQLEEEEEVPVACRSPPADHPNIWEEPSLDKFHEYHLLSTGATTASSSSAHPLPPDNSPAVPLQHDDHSIIYSLEHEYEAVQDSTIPAAPSDCDRINRIICLDDGGEIDLDDFFNSLPAQLEEEQVPPAHANNYYNDHHPVIFNAANMISQEEPAASPRRPCAGPQEQLLARIANLPGMSFQQLLGS